MSKNQPLHTMKKEELIAELEKNRRQLKTLGAKSAGSGNRAKQGGDIRDIHRLILENSSDPIYLMLPDQTVKYANKAFADSLGKPLNKVLGRKGEGLFTGADSGKALSALNWAITTGESTVFEVRLPHRKGTRHFLTTVKPLFTPKKKVSSVLCIAKDITDRKAMEDELRYISTHDSLTGLYNHHYYKTEMLRIQRSRMFPVSIVIVDIDGLRRIINEYGKNEGDVVIRSTAELLKQTFRTEDVVARIGLDEFGAVLPNTGPDELAVIVSRFQRNVERQKGRAVTVSMGWATAGKGGSLNDVMTEAEDRMHEEKKKKNGRG